MAKYFKTFLMIFLISAVICTVVSFCVLFSGKHLLDGFNRNDVNPVRNGWTLSDEDYSKSHIVSLPLSGNDIELLSIGSSYHLVHVLPKDLTNSSALSIPLSESKITISIDSSERFSFTGNGGFPKDSFPANGFFLIPLSAEDGGKLLEISVSSRSGSIEGFGLPLSGEKSDLLISLFFNQLPSIVSGIILVVFGAYILVSRLFSRYQKNYSRVYSGIGPFSIALGIWVFLKGGIIQLVTGNLSGLDALSHFCIILIPVPLVWHFFSITDGKYKVPATILSTASLVEAAVLTILVYVFGFNFGVFDPLISTTLIAAVFYSVAVVAISLLRSSESVKKYALVILANMSLAIGGLIQTVSVMLARRSNGFIFLFAVLLYLFFISFWRSRRSAGELKEKETAIKKAVTKSSFLANTSHEIRTPVNLIMSLNTMMKRDNNEESLVPYIKDMDNASRELKELVNKILISARIDSGKEKLIESDYSTVDLIEYLKRFMDSMKKQGVDPFLNVSPSLPDTLKGDAKKTLAICVSIIENAFKYTEKGAVLVSIYHEKTGNQKEIKLIINVHDTGRGLSAEKEAELFQQFSTNYSEAQGAGLGLYIAARYAGLMGGEIHCNRMGDCGTVFTASLIQKISGKKVEPQSAKPREEKKPVAIGPKNILVVDDVAINVTFAQMVIKESGHSAVTALSGEAAIQASREQGFDLILMDAQMPEMDGFETLRRIKGDKEGKNQKTIAFLLSADEGSDIEEKARSAGFLGCASKPLTKNSLLKMLSDIEKGES